MPEQAAYGQSAGALLKVFISYSRKDLEFADKLANSLQARNIDALIDRTAIYTFEDWWRRIQSLIQEADSVVFILSPDSVSSDICGKEVDYAASLNKRLAPVAYRPTDGKDVPAILRNLNFLFFHDEADYEQSLARLAEALTTNIDWLRLHTEFGNNARQWEEAGRPSGLLLRSPLLEQAEHWISSRPGSNAPAPTAETVRFITESRRFATRRRNQVTGSLAAGLLIAVALAGVAFWQRGVAQENAHTAALERDHATQLRNDAMLSQSRTLKTFSVQETTRGDAVTGMALALQGLPISADQPERPLVPETVDALDFALRSNLLIGEYALGGGDGSIVGTAYSPDGRRFAAGTNNGHVLVWDAAHNLLMRRFAITDGYFESLSFSPDGTRIAAAGETKAVVLNVATGTITTLVTAGKDQLIPTIAFGPNGRFVIGGTGSNFAMAWSAESGRPVQLYAGADPDEGLEAFLQDTHYGKAAETDEMKARLAKAQDELTRNALQERIGLNDMSLTFAKTAFSAVFSVAGGTPYAILSRDGKYLATSGKADPEAAVRLFDVVSGKLIVALKGHGRDAPAMAPPIMIAHTAFDYDADKLVSGGSDKTVRVWEAPSGKQLAAFKSQTEATALDIDTDGKTLAVGYTDGSAELIDIGSGRRTALAGNQAGSRIVSINFAGDDRKVAAGSQDGWIRTWWLPGGALATEVLAHRGSVWGTRYSPDGAQLLSYGADNTLRWWHAEDPSMHSAFAAETLAVHKFAVPVFTADGSRLVAPEGGAGTPEISALLDTETGRVVRRFKLGQLAPLRPDGTISLSRFNSFAIDRFDPATGALLAQDANLAPAKNADDSLKDSNNFVVDPTGRRIFARFDSPPRAQLFDAKTGKVIATLEVPGGKLDAPHFSALGDTLVGNIDDRGIAAWDAATGALLGTAALKGYTDEIQISRDGGYLVLRGGDGAEAAPIELVTLRPKVAVTRLQHHRFGAKAVAISNSGRLIAIGFEDGTLGVFTKRDSGSSDYDWQIVPQGTFSPIVALSLSEQPAILAACDDAGVVRIWNLQDQVPIVLARLPYPAAHIVLSSDGEKAAVLDKHGDLHIMSLFGGWGAKASAADIIAVGRVQGGTARTPTAASGPPRASVAKADAPSAASPAPNSSPALALPPQMPLAPRATTLAACDRLAAAPDDRDRQAKPVAVQDLNVKAAVAACRQAVADTPNDRLTLFQLGRSLEKGGILDEAKSIYRQAAGLGHAAATRHLALLLAKDGANADSAAMMERAVALGDPPALLLHAIELAKTQHPPDAAAALRYAVAASGKTPAQSSDLIGAILASSAAGDDTRSRALFFLELGRSLAARPQPDFYAALAGMDERAVTDGGMGALINMNRASWPDEIRGILARTLPPRRVADIQRAALAALASGLGQSAANASAEFTETAR